MTAATLSLAVSAMSRVTSQWKARRNWSLVKVIPSTRTWVDSVDIVDSVDSVDIVDIVDFVDIVDISRVRTYPRPHRLQEHPWWWSRSRPGRSLRRPEQEGNDKI